MYINHISEFDYKKKLKNIILNAEIETRFPLPMLQVDLKIGYIMYDSEESCKIQELDLIITIHLEHR